MTSRKRSQEAESQLAEQPRILTDADHAISRVDIAAGALKVLHRLERSGGKAYLVGGGVRDLLLGRRPKDFDVATDLRPERVRRLFPRSRIIGRRFRLVHVITHDGIVEVSTFRGNPDPNRQRRRGGELLVTSDNTYGTPREDAFRRDFTVNALFYRMRDRAVVDYVDGLRDLERRVMRVIGDPDVRFQEDPVRMLRACEFAGRLGFTIDSETRKAILRNRQELDKASPARLTEELLQLLHCGRCEPAFLFMLELGLLDRLLPEVRDLLTDRGDGRGFSQLLPTLDEWIRSDRHLADEVLLAAILAPSTLNRRARSEAKKGRIGRAALQRIAEQAVARLGTRFALSRAKSDHTYQALEILQRLCEPVPPPRQLPPLLRRPAFPEALDLFELMCEATGEGEEALEEWRRRKRDFKDPRPPARRRARRRRRRGRR